MTDEEQFEGFIANSQPILTLPQLTQQDLTHPTDFKPRTVVASLSLSKPPNETIQRSSTYLSEEEPEKRKVGANRCSPHIHIAHTEYLSDSSLYKLIYSRNAVPFSASPHFADHQVSLECMKDYTPLNYTLLRDWQGGSHDSQDSNDSKAPTDHEGPSLAIDSRFQSGNLLCGFQHLKQPYTYTLFIQNDTNSHGYTQWFYFSIQNMLSDRPYRFHIVNFRKKFSFYRHGMQPVAFSLRNHHQKANGWSRVGYNISYALSPLSGTSREYYALTFDMDFQHSSDYVTLSLGMPYTYSRLIHHLSLMKGVAQEEGIRFWRKGVAHTAADNLVPYVGIDDVVQKEKKSRSNKPRKKKMIIFMARQHPGQTWSSFLMEELMYMLLSKQCRYLREEYCFRFFPMVNPDGVIYGNFRCDLLGVDTNRAWKQPHRYFHGVVDKIKREIQALAQEYTIECCFDLHGHSKQYNIFCYSCHSDNLECRVIPYMLAKANPHFYFPYCTFGISKNKETTARAVIQAIAKTVNVVTIESSFYGVKQGGEIHTFTPRDFAMMAQSLLSVLKSYTRGDKQRKECEGEILKNMKELLKYERMNWEEKSGSDSDPAADSIELSQTFKGIFPSRMLSLIKKNSGWVSSQQTMRVEVKKDDVAIEKQESVLNVVYKPKRISKNPVEKYHLKSSIEPTVQMSRSNINKTEIKRRNLNEDVSANKVAQRVKLIHGPVLKSNIKTTETMEDKKMQFQSSMRRLYHFLQEKSQAKGSLMNDSSLLAINSIGKKEPGVRKRASTLKKMEPQESLQERAIKEERTMKEEIDCMPNLKHDNHQLNYSRLRETTHIKPRYAIPSKGQKPSMERSRQAEVMIKMWKDNYNRYSKDLKI